MICILLCHRVQHIPDKALALHMTVRTGFLAFSFCLFIGSSQILLLVFQQVQNQIRTGKAEIIIHILRTGLCVSTAALASRCPAVRLAIAIAFLRLTVISASVYRCVPGTIRRCPAPRPGHILIIAACIRRCPVLCQNTLCGSRQCR